MSRRLALTLGLRRGIRLCADDRAHTLAISDDAGPGLPVWVSLWEARRQVCEGGEQLRVLAVAARKSECGCDLVEAAGPGTGKCHRNVYD